VRPELASLFTPRARDRIVVTPTSLYVVIMLNIVRLFVILFVISEGF